MKPRDYKLTKEIKIDKTLGYYYFLDKEHPLSFGNNDYKIYYHRHIMSVYLNRWLTKDEIIHHKDSNKLNNNIDNLQICSKSEHSSIHQKERGYGIYEEGTCIICGKSILIKEVETKYCSTKCSNLGSRKFNIDKKTLLNLVWKYPTTKVAKMFNVSDVAISKRCKLLKIEKPQRGYWRKIETGVVAE